MPACDRVKPVNTPMAYSGMRRSTLAWVAITSRTETAERAMMVPRTPAGGRGR